MKQPNILLITSDQQHYNTIGAFNPELKTPNLDRLVNSGVNFDRAYCPNPTCTPTRGSMITGMYPSQHGGWTLGTKVKEDIPTLGDILKESGYHSSLIGKAHFQPLSSTEKYPSVEAYPVLQDLEFWKSFNDNNSSWYGFNHVELCRNHTDEAHVGQHYLNWLIDSGCDNWKDYFRKPTGFLEQKAIRNWEIPEEYHYDYFIANQSCKKLEEYSKADQPFFLWSSFFDPHPSYCVPEPYFSMYDPDELSIDQYDEGEFDNMPPQYMKTRDGSSDFTEYEESGYAVHGFKSHLEDEAKLRKSKAVYYGMITMMDKYIGTILDKLDELGLTDNTLIIFTTDHGHLLGQHGLNAKGAFMYEDLLKVPLIASFKGKIKGSNRTSEIVSLVDIAPTILGFAGIEIPNEMTGLNQEELFTSGSNSARDHAICEMHHEPTTVNVRTYIDAKYKLSIYYNKEYGELFDLESDPLEKCNLWNNDEYKDLKIQLLLKYTWAELGKEPMWMPRIAHA